MSVYGIPYTPYQIRTGSYSKQDIQTMVAIHLSWEAMNYFGYQIGVRHTLPRMAQHHAGSMAAARAQTAYPSALQGVIKTVTHMNPLAAMALVSAGTAIGYGATSDVHHGAIPGVTGFGGMGPGYYQGSDPMGQFRSGVKGVFEALGLA